MVHKYRKNYAYTLAYKVARRLGHKVDIGESISIQLKHNYAVLHLYLNVQEPSRRYYSHINIGKAKNLGMSVGEQTERFYKEVHVYDKNMEVLNYVYRII